MKIVLIRKDGVELNLGHCTFGSVTDVKDTRKMLALARSESVGSLALDDIKEVRIKL